MKLLKMGSKGNDVKRWQQFLADQGFSVTADGAFGRETFNGTVKFQVKYGLGSDGIVGHDTLVEATKHGFVLIEPAPVPTPSATKIAIRTTKKDNVTIYTFESRDIVFFTSDMMVDADGCPKAYHSGDTGIDLIANAGGLKPSIVAYDPATGKPAIQKANDPAPGYYVSMSSWQDPSPGVSSINPRKYVDSLSVPYIVVPGGNCGGAKVGNAALVLDLVKGTRVGAVVGDTGPTEKAGEASMFMCGRIAGLGASQITEELARKRGSVINPRNGGPSGNKFRYIVLLNTFVPWGSSASEIDGIVSAAWAQVSSAQQAVLTS